MALFSTAFEVYLGTDIRRWANYDLVEIFDEMLRYAFLPDLRTQYERFLQFLAGVCNLFSDSLNNTPKWAVSFV